MSYPNRKALPATLIQFTNYTNDNTALVPVDIARVDNDYCILIGAQTGEVETKIRSGVLRQTLTQIQDQWDEYERQFFLVHILKRTLWKNWHLMADSEQGVWEFMGIALGSYHIERIFKYNRRQLVCTPPVKVTGISGSQLGGTGGTSDQLVRDSRISFTISLPLLLETLDWCDANINDAVTEDTSRVSASST
jgi:hypothetical protein